MGSLSSRLRRGVNWSIAARLFGLAVKTGAVVVLARLLGPEPFGVVALLLSFTSILAVLVDFGISPGIARYLAEQERPSRETIKVAARTLAVMVSVAFIFVTAFAADFSNLLEAPFLTEFVPHICVILVSQVGIRFLGKLSEGLRNIDIYSKASLWGGWLPWGGALALGLGLGMSAESVLLGVTGGYLVYVLGLSVTLYRNMISRLPRESGAPIKVSRLAAYSIPMIASAVSFYIYTQSDVLLIQGYLGAEAVGVYSVVVRVAEAIRVPAAALGAAVAAFFPVYRSMGSKELAGLYIKTLRVVLAFYLPVSVGFALVGPELLEILFGPSYEGSGPVVVWYALYIVAIAVASFASLSLDYMGYAKLRAVAVSISAVLNIGVNLLLIPRFGIVGAAIATQVTYTPLVVIYVFVLGRLCDVSPNKIVSSTWRIGLASLCMAGVLALLMMWDANIAVMIGVGGTAYLVAALAMGAVSRQDLRSVFAPSST